MTTNAFWQQGEVQAGRALARPLPGDEEFVQTVLFPPTAVEIRVRVGLLPADDHVRALIEVVDPIEGTLLALRSFWHKRASDVGYWPTWIERTVEEVLAPILDPDPF